MAYVRENTCGSCSNYEYEGENSKGYCSYYRSYYYPDDSCSHWELNDRATPTSSNCFLTSACCEFKGKPDDCDELETLREFRDTYLKAKKYGEEIIRIYYEDAPAIVQQINSNPKREEIYEAIYCRIADIVDSIKRSDFEAAIAEYMMMVYKLKTRGSF